MTTVDTLVAHTRGLTRRFGQNTILKGIDLEVRDEEFIALIGKSGSGKSTLLRALSGLDYAVEGEGEVNVPQRVSFAFQDSRLLPWKYVLDNVTFGLKAKDAKQRGLGLLDEVGLHGRGKSWPYELSGGEQQRVALARALAGEPELLLMDEPFGALDALTRRKMHSLLLRLKAVHRPAIVMVTHDVEEAVLLADRVLVLKDGHIAEDIQVNAPLPRELEDPQLIGLRKDLLNHLGV